MKYSLFDSFQMITLASRAEFKRGRHDAVGVEVSVVAFILFGFMEGPVLIKVVAGAQGTQAQHGFSAGQAPTGASLPCGPLPSADRHLL